jgi:hypothetical protein
LKDIVSEKAGVEIGNITRGEDHQVKGAQYNIYPRKGCNLHSLIGVLENIK